MQQLWQVLDMLIVDASRSVRFFEPHNSGKSSTARVERVSTIISFLSSAKALFHGYPKEQMSAFYAACRHVVWQALAFRFLSRAPSSEHNLASSTFTSKMPTLDVTFGKDRPRRQRIVQSWGRGLWGRSDEVKLQVDEFKERGCRFVPGAACHLLVSLAHVYVATGVSHGTMKPYVLLERPDPAAPILSALPQKAGVLVATDSSISFAPYRDSGGGWTIQSDLRHENIRVATGTNISVCAEHQDSVSWRQLRLDGTVLHQRAATGKFTVLSVAAAGGLFATRSPQSAKSTLYQVDVHGVLEVSALTGKILAACHMNVDSADIVACIHSPRLVRGADPAALRPQLKLTILCRKDKAWQRVKTRTITYTDDDDAGSHSPLTDPSLYSADLLALGDVLLVSFHGGSRMLRVAEYEEATALLAGEGGHHASAIDAPAPPTHTHTYLAATEVAADGSFAKPHIVAVSRRGRKLTLAANERTVTLQDQPPAGGGSGVLHVMSQGTAAATPAAAF